MTKNKLLVHLIEVNKTGKKYAVFYPKSNKTMAIFFIAFQMNNIIYS